MLFCGEQNNLAHKMCQKKQKGRDGSGSTICREGGSLEVMKVICVIDKVSLGASVLSAVVDIVRRVVAAYNEGMRCHLDLKGDVLFFVTLCAGFD